MKARRSNKGSERRRNLAEINLLTEPRARVAPTRRGCVVPFIGVGLLALAAIAAWAGPALL
jgi:hypothetical protein